MVLLITHHLCSRSKCRPSLSATSEARIESGRSCLLAKTSRVASRSSPCKKVEKLFTYTTVHYIKDLDCVSNKQVLDDGHDMKCPRRPLSCPSPSLEMPYCAAPRGARSLGHLVPPIDILCFSDDRSTQNHDIITHLTENLMQLISGF